MSHSTAIKDEAVPASPVAEQSEDAKSDQPEVKELLASLKNLTQKRRVFRQCQLNYIRIKKAFIKHLQPPVAEEADKTAESRGSPKDPETVQEEKVHAAHRLLRNFNYAVNVQTMGREDDKRVFPEKFAAEIESIFEDKDALEKVKKALQTNTKEDQQKELPKQLAEKTLKGVTDFIEKHEKVEILDKLESQLEEMTKVIDEKRARLKVLRPESEKAKSAPSSGQSKKSKNSNSAKKSAKTSSDQEDQLPAEERFRLLIKEVNDRVRAVKLKKDDFELYVNMQQEIDTFLHEAMTEIRAIKKRFKDRFDAVQAGTDRRRRVRSRSNSRRPKGSNNDLQRS